MRPAATTRLLDARFRADQGVQQEGQGDAQFPFPIDGTRFGDMSTTEPFSTSESDEPVSERPKATNAFLSNDHLQTEDIYLQWDQGNQQWWDWYVSLADNSESSAAGSIGPEGYQDPPPPERIGGLDEFVNALNEPYPISNEQVDFFQRQGYIKLKGVLDPGVMHVLRVELKRLFRDALADDPTRKFSSLEMMWLESPICRTFALSPRLGGIAAALIGVDAVRLYHDNGLSKEPGCGRTPWHYDATHFPIDSLDVLTLWAPLQAIPHEMGPLMFAEGIDTYKAVEAIPFNKFDTSYDSKIIRVIEDHGISIHDDPFELGEVSFHHTLNCHAAGSNRTSIQRMVLATTYFADGAKVVERPTMVSGDWKKFMPGVEAGQLIDSPHNPVCYPVNAVHDADSLMVSEGDPQ